MRIRRVMRSVSTFMTQLGVAIVKTVFTSVILGVVVVGVMRYMGVPVPYAYELLRGISRLADVL